MHGIQTRGMAVLGREDGHAGGTPGVSVSRSGSELGGTMTIQRGPVLGQDGQTFMNPHQSTFGCGSPWERLWLRVRCPCCQWNAWRDRQLKPPPPIGRPPLGQWAFMWGRNCIRIVTTQANREFQRGSCSAGFSRVITVGELSVICLN